MDNVSSLPNNPDCGYTHDDLGRIASVNCNQASGPIWGQNFAYDRYGNITKTQTAGSAGTFNVTYNNNRITSSGYAYDQGQTGPGNLTSDGTTNYTYAWDADGRPTSINGTGIIVDAFDRIVEATGNYILLYSPTGAVSAKLNSSNQLIYSEIPLMGGGVAEVNNAGVTRYRRPNWLGSFPLITDSSSDVCYDGTLAPFGENYDQGDSGCTPPGTTDLWFTGKGQLTVSGLYDFPFREYEPQQGRWISPDPAGAGAVDVTNPQSWNRYAYVGNSPLNSVDPLGLEDPSCDQLCQQSTIDQFFGGAQQGSWTAGDMSNWEEEQFWGDNICQLPGYNTPTCMLNWAENWQYAGVVSRSFHPTGPGWGLPGEGDTDLRALGCWSNWITDANWCPNIGAFMSNYLEPIWFGGPSMPQITVIGGGFPRTGATIANQQPPAQPQSAPQSTGTCMTGELINNFIGSDDKTGVTLAVNIAAFVARQGAGSLLPGPGWLYTGTAIVYDVAQVGKAYLTCHNNISNPDDDN